MNWESIRNALQGGGEAIMQAVRGGGEAIMQAVRGITKAHALKVFTVMMGISAAIYYGPTFLSYLPWIASHAASAIYSVFSFFFSFDTAFNMILTGLPVSHFAITCALAFVVFAVVCTPSSFDSQEECRYKDPEYPEKEAAEAGKKPREVKINSIYTRLKQDKEESLKAAEEDRLAEKDRLIEEKVEAQRIGEGDSDDIDSDELDSYLERHGLK